MGERNLAKILIVEDSPHFQKFLSDKLRGTYDITSTYDAESANEAFMKQNFDLVLLDLGLPRVKGASTEILGFDLLRKFKDIDPHVEVIILTGTSREIDSAIRAIKEGAYHFLIKDDYHIFAEKLQMLIRNALEKRKLAQKNEALKKQSRFAAAAQRRVHRYLHPDLTYHFGFLLGESEPMQEVYRTIEKLRERGTEESVLIYGENGTGKELAALSIHATSPRADHPWIVADIASLPPNLVESELFGIEKRVATQVDKRIGYFEQADGSTIFLDEIGEVPPEIQVKLLRVLQNRTIQRIGSSKPIPVNVRVISATNKNLEEMKEKGAFRQDLFFRLAVIPITMPPLRDRPEDIPDLVKHTLYAIQQEEKNVDIQLLPDALSLLQNCEWPGNVRELENVIKKAVILRNSDRLSADDFRDIFPHRKIATGYRHNPLDKLPKLSEIPSKNGKSKFKEISDEHLKKRIFLRTFIEHEGLMKQVLDDLQIARATGYRLLEETQPLFLAGLCQNDSRPASLAQAWQVDRGKLERTIRKANRFANYFQQLEEQFNHDTKRIAAFLNAQEDQVQRLAKYFSAT